MHGWAQEITRAVADAEHREYVDDLTAFRVHSNPDGAAQQVRAMESVSQDLETDARLQLNRTKSRASS